MVHLQHSEDTGQLPTSHYKILIGEKEVGILQIRHTPSVSSDLPQHMASHIYYEIKESERGRGYGTTVLSLAKTEAKRLGLTELLLSVWQNNLPSKKIIEKNGGVLVCSYFSDQRKDQFLLYKIVL